MQKFVFFLSLILAVGMLTGCASSSGAVDAYEEFARALAENDFDAALELTASTSPAKA